MDARARDLTVPHMGAIIWIRGAFLCVCFEKFPCDLLFLTLTGIISQ